MMNFERNFYRGKRIDNGEWVYGFYVPVNYAEPLIVTGADIDDYSEIEFDDYYHVNNKSVGQFTGLTDKNGKKIFEGDIVEYPIESGGYKGENIHEVVFENRHGTAYFGIKMSNIETWGFDMEVPAKLMKIIGNIHDTPDLLEVKK